MAAVRPPSALLWQEAHDLLQPKEKAVIPPNFATKPEELVVEVDKYITESKGHSIKLPNGQKLFVRDVLQKISRWIRRFVEVGDAAVQYDPGHAALPWALLRLVLQLSMNNIEKHALVLEGVEKISYYLIWSQIEEAFLAFSFEAHAQLRHKFVELYKTILTFTARSLRFLRNKPERIVGAFFSSGSKFQKDEEEMISHKQSIEDFVRQISDQTIQKQSQEIAEVNSRLANLDQPILRIEQISESTSAIIERQENQQTLDWASQIPYYKPFRLAQEKALSGTGAWLRQDPRYIAWESSSRSQMIWLHGGAGSGKSTLLSIIIQSMLTSHKERQTSYPIFFFCSRDTAEPERGDPEQILRSLMRQASDLPGGPLLHSALRDRFNKRRVEGDDVSAKEASNIIINTIEQRPITYIMIDALDECNRQRRGVLLDALKTILTTANSLIKIFVTNASQNRADITYYVQSSVQRAIDEKHLLGTEPVTADLQLKIVNALCNGADGMFRWVELQLNYLCTTKKRSILLKRLESLSPGLEKIYEELYDHNMRELGDEQAEVVRKILAWLLVAKRPLSTAEICQLVCTPDEADMSIETVLDMTFDLVRLDAEQDCFRLSHLSVREFLEKNQRGFLLASLHGIATNACLSRLTVDDKANSVEDYACLFWCSHAEETIQHGGGSIIEQQLNEFLSVRNKRFLRWNRCMFEARLSKRRRRSDSHSHLARISSVMVHTSSPLLIAACFGLITPMRRILSDVSQPIDLEIANDRGDGALCLATTFGQTQIVQILLKHGANACASSSFFGSILLAASYRGHAEIVQLLLDRGAEVNAQGPKGNNSLHAACVKGYIEIVQLLLDGGADINAQGRYGNALCAASGYGHIDIVQLLLDRGAEVNAQGPKGDALYAASYRGNAEVVRLLLERGADVNARGNQSSNAMQAASQNGNVEAVKALLEYGAKAYAEEGDERNALYVAASNGWLQVVQLLLDYSVQFGVQVNAREQDGTTALYTASLRGYVKIVEVLLRSKADVNAQGGEYGNPLQAASFRCRLGIVGLLLDHGAVVNAKGGRYGNALRAALCVNENAESGELLNELERYCNRRRDGLDCVHPDNVSEAQVQIIDLLLKHGAIL